MNLRKDHFNNKQQQKTFLTPRFLLFIEKKKTVGLELTRSGKFFGIFFSPKPFFFHTKPLDLDTNVTSANASNNIHLSTMDLLVLATMKNAAKCENVV